MPWCPTFGAFSMLGASQRSLSSHAGQSFAHCCCCSWRQRFPFLHVNDCFVAGFTWQYTTTQKQQPKLAAQSPRQIIRCRAYQADVEDVKACRVPFEPGECGAKSDHSPTEESCMLPCSAFEADLRDMQACRTPYTPGAQRIMEQCT